MQILIFPIKNSLFTNKLIVQPFSAVAVGAGVFCRLHRVDSAQIISTRAVEIIGAGAAKAEDQFFRDAFDQTDADRQRMVDAANVLFGQMPDEVAQATLINCTQLFQQNDRRQFQVAPSIDVVMSGKFGFLSGFTCNRGNDNRRTVFVSNIILDDYDRTAALLFRADTMAQIGVVYIAT